jgi:hypothetical protein
MAFVSISYDEPNQNEYESVNVSSRKDDKTVKFDSGNFVKDWWDAMKYLIVELEWEYPTSFSSSVGHFITDGDNYDSMYLVDDEDSPKGSELQSEYTEDGIEFFVPKGTQLTWLELTEYVNTINKELEIKN